MENPYIAPSTVMSPPLERRRPFGVAILAVLTGIGGLVMLAAFVVVVMNWREHTEFAVNRRMAPSVFWFSVGLGVVMPLAACVGMWKGAKWGWWIACFGMVMTFVQNAGSALIANLSQGSPSVETLTSVDSLKFSMRGVIAALTLAYWLRTSVRRYFGMEQTSHIKAVMLAAVCGFGTMIIVISVLQFIFLWRTR